MTPEHDEYLCKTYPNLYRDRNASIKTSCFGWGFECGDGWFDLIDKLSSQLEKEILKVPEGHRAEIRAAQVKEKFARLRFYMTTSSTKMSDLIHKAEAKSGKICEVCGKPGRVMGQTWMMTRCKKHAPDK